MPLSKRIHHFMLQAQRFSDIGIAFERAQRHKVPLSLELGQHPDPDGTFSFYGATPSGFDFEIGAGTQTIDPDGWQTAAHRRDQRLGPQAEAAPAAEDGRRFDRPQGLRRAAPREGARMTTGTRRWLKRGALALLVLVALAAAALFAGEQLARHKMQRKVDIAVKPVAYREDAAAVERGRYLFASRGCVDCHGAQGNGRTFLDDGKGMRIAGPNISPGPGSVGGRLRARGLGARHPPRRRPRRPAADGDAQRGLQPPDRRATWPRWWPTSASSRPCRAALPCSSCRCRCAPSTASASCTMPPPRSTTRCRRPSRWPTA